MGELPQSWNTAASRDMLAQNFGGKEHLMIAILVLILILGWNSTLLAQVLFYQGKTISILVDTKAGDVYAYAK